MHPVKLQQYKDERNRLKQLTFTLNGAVYELCETIKRQSLFIPAEVRALNEALADIVNARAKIEEVRGNLDIILKKN